MALANFDDLKSAVTTWMTRSDMSGQAEDFITLAEARLNRELPAVETESTLTGTVNLRTIDVSSLSVVEPISLYLTRSSDSTEELELTKMADFPYVLETGEPQQWTLKSTNIVFDFLLDQAYSFRFRYRQRFALSTGSPTNWLLTNHPDVYLAAVLIWGGVFVRNPQYAAIYAPILVDAIPSVRNIIAQSRRGTLVVDEALQLIGRRHRYGYYDGNE